MDSSFQRTTSVWLPDRLTPVLAPSVNVNPAVLHDDTSAVQVATAL